MSAFKTVREKMNLTQGQIGQLVGITQTEVSTIELGKRQPGLKLLLKYAILARQCKYDLLGDLVKQLDDEEAETYFQQ